MRLRNNATGLDCRPDFSDSNDPPPMKCRFLFAAVFSFFAAHPCTEQDGKIQILLLGDSTTEAKFPKVLAPNEPQLEDIIRILLAAEGDLPPTNVINLGLSGEFIRRLLDSGRYDK